MQPKFTLKDFGFLPRVFVLALIFVLTGLASYSQQGRPLTKQELAEQEARLMLSDNDAGRPNMVPAPHRIQGTAPGVQLNGSRTDAQRPEAICATYNGSLEAGDPTVPGPRMFRDGIPSTCAAPKAACPGTSSPSGTYYDTYNFTNTQAIPQCVTISITNTSATSFAQFASAHLGSFNPASICTNYLADLGGSPAAGATGSFSFTLPGNATAVIVVTSVAAAQSSTYTLTIDGICAPCIPVNADQPTISSVPSSTCAGSPITLSVIGGSLNGAADWQWYSGSCGGTPVGSGGSITVSPAATTTYYVRGEGGCAPAAGPCGSQTVTVTSCSCLTPDVATICAGSIQRITVTPTGATTQSFNGGAVNIPAGAPGSSGGIGGPYPSAIAVAGLPTGGVYVSSVSINGISHTWPADIDMVLQSPSGQNVILMSDVGGSTDIVGANLVFSDAAATGLVSPIVSGTYKPTNTSGPDNFPAPGPGSVLNVNPTLSTFTGNPNGNWNLFVNDQFGGDYGNITSWSITFSIVPTATWSPTTDLYSNAAATIPYVAGTVTDVVWAKPAVTTTYTATIGSGPCAGANNVTVTVLPRPNISISPAAGGCAPIDLTASGGTIYNWSPAVGLSATTGATVTAAPESNTIYTVLGYGANGCSNTATVAVGAVSTSAVISANVAPIPIFSEGFDDVTPLPAGWSQQNLSTPTGTNPDWFQGNSGVFPAQSGPPTAYIAANFNGVAGNNTISNWLFTPTVTMQNGDIFTFYTRTVSGPAFPDRLEVRMSTNGNSTNVGATNTSVGDFTNLLLTVNPNLTTSGYPSAWTQFTATITGLAGPTSGKLAFRYFVTSAGPSGSNSDYIGVDNVVYARPQSAVCANTVNNLVVDITGGVGPFTLVFSNGTTNTTFNSYNSGDPIQVSPAVTTTYTLVSVTGANGCAGIGLSGAATINITPPPSITTQPANRAACDGGNTSFTVTAAPATGNNFQWQISTDGGANYANLADGGLYSGTSTSTLTITGVTTSMSGYRYRVIITGACPPNTVTSTGALLSVNIPPTITTDPADDEACDGDDASFSVVATGNNPTYQWQVSDDGGANWTDIAGATGSTLTVSNVNPGMDGNQYRVVVTVAPCGTTATSGAATLTVNNLPTVTIAASTLAITPGQSATITATSNPAAQDANSYAWTLNGSGVSPVVTTNPYSATVDGLGTYQVAVTDINGCEGLSNELVITGAQSDRLWIYPNPSSGQFQVRLYSSGNPTEQRVVSVFTSTGQLIDRKKFTLTNTNGPYLRMDFDLSKAAPGTYLIKVEDRYNKVITSGFFVKQ